MTETPKSKTGSLRIHLLGVLRVYDGETLLAPPGRRDAERLLAYLLLHRDRVLERARLAESLWPDSERARFQLRHSLSTLRKYLAQVDEDSDWIISDHKTVTWNEDADYWLDLAEIEAASDLPQELSSSAEGLSRLRTASKWLGQGLLVDLDEPWLDIARSQHEYIERRLLAHLATAEGSVGQFSSAIETARRLVSMDELRETSNALLIQLSIDTRDAASAIRHFQVYKDRIRRALDIEPSDHMRDLLTAAQSLGRGAGSAEGPGARQASLEKGARIADRALPLPALPETRFFDAAGRLAEVESCLSDTRLLSLTGPPGSGKSRLALEFAHRMEAGRRHQVFYLDLASVRDDAGLRNAIVERLALPAAVADLEASMAAFVHAMPETDSILILDNPSLALRSLAPLIKRLLKKAPNLRIVAASRRPLALAAERQLRIEGLGLGSPGGYCSADAQALFLDRLNRHFGPKVTMDPLLPDIVSSICLKLGDTPMLIERAALLASMPGPDSEEISLEALLEIIDEKPSLLEQMDAVGAITGQRFRSVSECLDWDGGADLMDCLNRAFAERLLSQPGWFGLRDLDQALEESISSNLSRSTGEQGLSSLDFLNALRELQTKGRLIVDLSRPADARYRVPEIIRLHWAWLHARHE